eukprot:TRINITY_DN65412_c0_g1_i1.p1 TRINITY_DN65412_c0_g1~~TRINITY_DN65412_c0_g1_i1.p1  ORF type:complete len:914 (+),score=194.06 TRINITY_DN65412_c0_g1_i1:104-2845(+)
MWSSSAVEKAPTQQATPAATRKWRSSLKAGSNSQVEQRTLPGAAPQAGWLPVECDDDCPARNARVDSEHRRWLMYSSSKASEAFIDAEFAPGPRSVDGREEKASGAIGAHDYFKATMSELGKQSAEPVSSADDPPLCRCGQPARQKRVNRPGVTNGRPYFTCALRECNFFEFADRLSSLAALELTWKRFAPGTGSKWRIVGDEGFRPKDLQQGGVGDCWFMSALAVVAERHDLMSKLLPNLNNGGASGGCHEVRLFLDGHWRSVLIDDHLPTTAKQKRPTEDGSGIVFGRGAKHQLWVCHIEKAYAKAHGAYNSISGGITAEALLDLTGAPCETVHFKDPSFDREFFWGQLLSLLQAGCLVGCGTNSETIEELGLVGQHAYSVLEAKEEVSQTLLGESIERLVRVRNPWGEWTRREYDEMLAQLGVPITPGDGCFWMNYGDFLRGFSGADICHAREGWHARSFDTEFGPADTSAGSSTGCRAALRVRMDKASDCWFMALQPTERGKRLKRPRGYYLNDLSLLVIAADTGETVSLILAGAKREVSTSVFLDAKRDYIVVPLSFRASRGLLTLRIYCAATAQAQLCAPPSGDLVWQALHKFMLRPTLPPRTQRLVHHLPHQAGKLVILEAPAMALGFVVNDHDIATLSVAVTAAGNHAAVRTAAGLVEGTKGESRSAGSSQRKAGKGKGGRNEPRPDWKEYILEAAVPPANQQLVWVAVSLNDQGWEFCLESTLAEQLPGAPGGKISPGDAFAARPVERDALIMLPRAEVVSHAAGRSDPNPLEDLEDLELLAAILASEQSARQEQAEEEKSPLPEHEPLYEQDREDREVGEEEDDVALQLALQMSLAEQGEMGEPTKAMQAACRGVEQIAQPAPAGYPTTGGRWRGGRGAAMMSRAPAAGVAQDADVAATGLRD